jgi:hypothetical protein
MLYSIFTADLPETRQTMLATYADDTNILASHENPTEASRLFQTYLDQYAEWLQQWRIKVNETKSVHITFTLKQGTCPPGTIKWNTHTTKRINQILGPSPGQAIDMAHTYLRPEKTTRH